MGTSVILSHFKSGSRRLDTVMEVLGSDEFNLIYNRGYNYNSPKYGIVKVDEDVFVGKLDFDNPSVLGYIHNLKIVPELGYTMYSGFNFETSEIKTEEGHLKWYDTWNDIKIMKYKYCQIGKPKYVIIFKAFAKH